MNTKRSFNKRDLLRLSKKELRKKCQSYNLPTVGTKLELIDRLLNNKNTSNFKQKKTIKISTKKVKKLLDTLSGKEATNYLLYGYIHNYKNIDIPNGLILIIFKYLGDNIFMRFDICFPNKYMNSIQNNGRSIFRGKHNETYMYMDKLCVNETYICFGSSIKFNSGIHKFKLKIKQKIGLSDCIGIIPNIYKLAADEEEKHIDMFNIIWTAPNFYYLRGGQELGCSHQSEYKFEPFRDESFGDGSGWKVKDVVTVFVNCNKWFIKFEINGKTYGKKVKITPNITYYPVVLSLTDKCGYHLIYTNN
eukprot:6568_1